MERNYPTIYLYGSESADGDEQAAKVRIAFSRERDDKNRAEKQEGEWTCRIVSQHHSSGHTVYLQGAVYLCQLPWPFKVFPLSDTSDW